MEDVVEHLDAAEVVLEAQYMILCSPGSASPPQLPSKVPAEPLVLQENMNEEIQLSLAELTALSRVHWTLWWFHQASAWILAELILVELIYQNAAVLF